MSFGRSFGKSSKKPPLCRLEIRTDADFVMFRGRPSTTEPQMLKGRIILMNTDTIDTKSIKITLEGKRRTSHNLTKQETEAGLNIFAQALRTKHIFHHDEKSLKSEPLRLPPGNHEFPFEFELPGDACESIEGFPSTPPLFQIYQLHVTIERRFPFKPLTETRHIRVVRTIGTEPEELLDSEGITGNWAGKIMYEWSIRNKAVIYGDQVTVDFALTPIADKLRIGKLKFYIREIVQIKTSPGLQDLPDRMTSGNMWEEIHRAGETIQEAPDDCPEDLHPDLLIPQKKFTRTFDLPRSLNECRQSVDEGEWILIRHRLHVDVLLHNADGHFSELKAHIPIRLYISPDMPIGEDNAVTTPRRNLSSSSLQATATATPPTYGSHTRDQPVNPFYEINPSGFATPAAGSRSGAATPGYDRLGSSEQVPRLSHFQQPPLPDDLSARLESLQMSRTEEEAARHHLDYDLDSLERITSYNTAVRNPGPANYSNLPPTYADATSRPPSPPMNQQGASPLRNGSDASPTDDQGHSSS